MARQLHLIVVALALAVTSLMAANALPPRTHRLQLPGWAENCWPNCSSTGLWGNPYEPAGLAVMQTDGHLVTYNAYGQPTWASWTYGNPSAYLAIGDDGSLRVLSPTGSVLWSR